MRTHVLDAGALYRCITGGAGTELVIQVFEQAASGSGQVAMSAVNYGEAYYSLTKLIGTKRTESELEIILTNTPLRIISAAPEHAVRAARLKAQFGLPYADAFAAELALPGGIVVTSDADHFRRIPKLKLLALPRA